MDGSNCNKINILFNKKMTGKKKKLRKYLHRLKSNKRLTSRIYKKKKEKKKPSVN